MHYQTSCTTTGLPIFTNEHSGCHPLEMVLGLTFCHIERQACGQVYPALLPCSPLPLGRRHHPSNHCVSNSLSNFPIIQDPVFKPALLDSAFHMWFQNGLKSDADLNHFVSFDFLVKEYDVPRSHFFRYFKTLHKNISHPSQLAAPYTVTYPLMPLRHSGSLSFPM